METLRALMVEADLQGLGHTSLNGNRVQVIQEIAMIRERLGSFLSGKTPSLVSATTGALGFEPRDGGTKTRCLTTWRRPNNFTFFILAVSDTKMSSVLLVE